MIKAQLIPQVDGDLRLLGEGALQLGLGDNDVGLIPDDDSRVADLGTENLIRDDHSLHVFCGCGGTNRRAVVTLAVPVSDNRQSGLTWMSDLQKDVRIVREAVDHVFSTAVKLIAELGNIKARLRLGPVYQPYELLKTGCPRSSDETPGCDAFAHRFLPSPSRPICGPPPLFCAALPRSAASSGVALVGW